MPKLPETKTLDIALREINQYTHQQLAHYQQINHESKNNRYSPCPGMHSLGTGGNIDPSISN